MLFIQSAGDRGYCVLLQLLRAAGFRATDKCFGVYPACQDGAGSTRTSKRIPDIVATDQYGTTTAYDVMITHPTGRTAAAHKPLHAATKGERGKQAGYDAHKAKCRALGSTDPGLDMPLIPLLFETYGAAGKNMQGLLPVVCLARKYHLQRCTATLQLQGYIVAIATV